MPGHNLILLSCSRYKRQGGLRFDDSIRGFASRSSLPKLSGRIFLTRKHIFNLLRGEGGKLYNEDQKGGFRHQTIANQTLQPGPDFGGQAPNAEVYLPAHKRYSGRFFSELDRVAPNFWSEMPKYPIEILFVSGLYGLLYWDEPIQEYDCHLNDYCESDKKPISSLWRPVLAEVLSDFLKARAKTNHPIQQIYDLLSEEIYQKVFDWQAVPREVSLHHRIFQGVAGPDILPYLAEILGKHLAPFCQSEPRHQNGKWIDYVFEDRHEDKFSFESEIGTDHRAMREGDLRKVKSDLLENISG